LREISLTEEDYSEKQSKVLELRIKNKIGSGEMGVAIATGVHDKEVSGAPQGQEYPKMENPITRIKTQGSEPRK
jgi:hypothetical protein